VRQVWDPNHLFSDELRKAREGRPSAIPDARLRTDKREDGVLYDTVALFTRDEKWERTLPPPSFLDGGVAAVLEEVESLLEKLPGQAVQPSTPTDGARTSQLNEAQLVLERHCGVCHREDSPEAKSGALAVFNLNDPNWAASMPDDRLRDARGRIRDMQPRGSSDDRALDGHFGGTTTAGEVATFDAFVAAELDRRGVTGEKR
jgi:hypothetical protein